MSIVTSNPDTQAVLQPGHTDNDDDDEDVYEHGANKDADKTTTATATATATATTTEYQQGTLQTVNNQPAVSAPAASEDTRGTYVEEGVMVEDVVMMHGMTRDMRNFLLSNSRVRLL